LAWRLWRQQSDLGLPEASCQGRRGAISTAYEMGWAKLENRDLLSAAEASFAAFITTDQNLRHQQNLAGRRLAILALPTTSWPMIQLHLPKVAAAANTLSPGDFVELTFS
jgi:hypothetical protein